MDEFERITQDTDVIDYMRVPDEMAERWGVRPGAYVHVDAFTSWMEEQLMAIREGNAPADLERGFQLVIRALELGISQAPPG